MPRKKNAKTPRKKPAARKRKPQVLSRSLKHHDQDTLTAPLLKGLAQILHKGLAQDLVAMSYLQQINPSDEKISHTLTEAIGRVQKLIRILNATQGEAHLDAGHWPQQLMELEQNLGVQWEKPSSPFQTAALQALIPVCVAVQALSPKQIKARWLTEKNHHTLQLIFHWDTTTPRADLRESLIFFCQKLGWRFSPPGLRRGELKCFRVLPI